MPSRNDASVSDRRRFWSWLVALSALPAVLFLSWRGYAMELFLHREPYIDLFFFHDSAFVWISLGTLFVAGAAALYPRAILPGWEQILGRHPGLAIVVFGLVAAGLAVPVHHGKPFTMDEYAAVFQGKVFAEGKWAAQIPEWLSNRVVLRIFMNYFLTSDGTGRIIESYLPGYALLLAPFVKLGIESWLNVLLGACTLGLLVLLARKWIGRPEATGWLLLLVAASPVFWMNSLSFYSLNARLVFNLLFAYCLSDFSSRRAFLAGLAGGMAIFLHNPFPHAVFALPWVVYLVFKKEHRRLLPPLLLGYLPFILLTAGWFYLVWKFQTASPASPSSGEFTHAWDLKGAVTPPPIAMETFVYYSILLCKLLLWTAPGLWLFLGLGRKVLHPALRLSLFSFLLTLVAYSLAGNRVNQGFGWGHRYTYAALGGVFLVSAAWLSGLRAEQLRLRNAALALGLAGLLTIVPLRLVQSSRFIAGQNAKLPCLPPEVPQVCLVAWREEYYVLDRIQNDPFLRSPRLVLGSLGREQDRPFMEKHFPRHTLLRWDGKNGVWLPPAGETNRISSRK